MNIQHKHNCNNAKEHNYTADMSKIIRDTKEIDPTTLSKIFSVTLPNKQVVELKPATYGDVVKILQNMKPNEELTTEQEYESLKFSIQTIIKKVDEISDRGHINEWIDKINSAYVKKIKASLQQIEGWGAENVVKLKCKDCNKMMKVNIPINPLTFFS